VRPIPDPDADRPRRRQTAFLPAKKRTRMPATMYGCMLTRSRTQSISIAGPPEGAPHEASDIGVESCTTDACTFLDASGELVAVDDLPITRDGRLGWIEIRLTGQSADPLCSHCGNVQMIQGLS